MLNTVHFDPWQRSLFVPPVSSANTKEKGPLLAGKVLSGKFSESRMAREMRSKYVQQTCFNENKIRKQIKLTSGLIKFNSKRCWNPVNYFSELANIHCRSFEIFAVTLSQKTSSFCLAVDYEKFSQSKVKILKFTNYQLSPRWIFSEFP